MSQQVASTVRFIPALCWICLFVAAVGGPGAQPAKTSLETSSETQAQYVFYYKANTPVKDPRLAFEWRAPIAMRMELQRAANHWRVEVQSLPDPGFYIEIQSLILRAKPAELDQIMQSYLGPDCEVTDGQTLQSWHCGGRPLAGSDVNFGLRRYARVWQQDDKLHIFYMAYHKDFSVAAGQIVGSLREKSRP